MAETTSKTPILGIPQADASQMIQFVREVNPSAPDYAQRYLDLGRRYGIRGDLAYAQSILETNYWRFGGSVQPHQNNFAGLGATGGSAAGASFQTPEQGIEAQMQHLYGYATTAPLPPGTVIVDPRFQILQNSGLRGTAPNWEDLNGKWAVPGTQYGQNIVSLWRKILSVPVSPNSWKRDAMQWLSDQGLINSPHDPDAAVTWAELGTVLKRLRDLP